MFATRTSFHHVVAVLRLRTPDDACPSHLLACVVVTYRGEVRGILGVQRSEPGSPLQPQPLGVSQLICWFSDPPVHHSVASAGTQAGEEAHDRMWLHGSSSPHEVWHSCVPETPVCQDQVLKCICSQQPVYFVCLGWGFGVLYTFS